MAFKDLLITPEELQSIFSADEQRSFDEITTGNVYCLFCKGTTGCGIKEYTITLNKLNDVILRGRCTVCSSRVSRYMEFGEDPAFGQRASKLRKIKKRAK